MFVRTENFFVHPKPPNPSDPCDLVVLALAGSAELCPRALETPVIIECTDLHAWLEKQPASFEQEREQEQQREQEQDQTQELE